MGAQSEQAIQAFIDSRLYKIRGFLHPADAMTLAAISQYQSAQSWGGGVAEIGVFFGRSLTLLAKMLQPSEKAYAIDLFDIGAVVGGETEQLRYFRNILQQEGVPAADVPIQVGDSGQLTPADIMAKVGPVRLFSVDGGHEKRHVDHDSRLALGSLSEQGVIVFDDFMNAQYPDVSVSIIDFLRDKRDEVEAFCITKNKLYVCRKAYYASYVACVEQARYEAAITTSRFKFLDGEVVFCEQSLVSRALYQKLSERGLGSLATKVLRPRKSKFSRD